jgi:hypothetical protein
VNRLGHASGGLDGAGDRPVDLASRQIAAEHGDELAFAQPVGQQDALEQGAVEPAEATAEIGIFLDGTAHLAVSDRKAETAGFELHQPAPDGRLQDLLGQTELRGQLSRGDTVPEMETFLFNLEEGQISPVPVRTRYGVHVVRVDKRVPGRALPYEAVAGKVADYLKEASWRRAFRQYVQLLAGDARISGFDIAAAESPLVQ